MEKQYDENMLLQKNKTTKNILINLENHFYVSSVEKSLYDYLVNGPECPEERNYPLRRRIGIELFEDE